LFNATFVNPEVEGPSAAPAFATVAEANTQTTNIFTVPHGERKCQSGKVEKWKSGKVEKESVIVGDQESVITRLV